MSGGGMTKLEETIARFEHARDELREATREAHAATKDLRAVAREVRDLLELEPKRTVDAAIAEKVAAGLERYGEVLSAAMSSAVDKVGTEFDRLASIYLTGADGNGPSLEELARRRKEGLPYVD
jgi:hypothetical protein